jgi:hypothetical protein
VTWLLLWKRSIGGKAIGGSPCVVDVHAHSVLDRRTSHQSERAL